MQFATYCGEKEGPGSKPILWFSNERERSSTSGAAEEAAI
jgi:hypothetical protein